MFLTAEQRDFHRSEQNDRSYKPRSARFWEPLGSDVVLLFT